MARLSHILEIIAIFHAYANAAQNCDRSYTASVGVISSPNFPGYPAGSNTICKYNITASLGKRIQITFDSHPNVADSYGCYYGGIRIYEGGMPDLVLDTPSAQYCSSRFVTHKTYLSVGSSLMLVFTNRYYYYSFRFKLKYRFTEGLNLVHKNSEGLLYSPYFMNRFLNRNQTYHYRIEATAGMKIYAAISYINFGTDTACLNSSLSIYEGTDASGNPREIRCGGDTTDYLSTTNVITLKYNCTFYNETLLPNDHGFIVFYTIGTDGCNKSYSASTGNIYSPLYPNVYPNNTFCTYNVTSTPGNLIYAAFRYMSVVGEPLQVFEKDPATGLSTLRKSFYDQNAYYSFSNSLLVKFASDGISTSYGYMMEFIVTNGCNLKLNSYSYIPTPLFPLNYPNNAVCNYTFNSGYHSSYRPVVEMLQTDIEGSDSCSNDSVSIYDGSSASATLLDSLCGVKSYYRYMAARGSLFVQFKSSASISRQGFFAKLNGRYIACTSHSSRSSTVQSPNYPYRYPHKMHCSNYFTNDYGNLIMLRFNHFDLQADWNCSKDSLKIYEGSISDTTLSSTRCGNDTTPYISKTGKLYLVFTSDSTISLTGYSISYSMCGNSYYSYNEFSITSPTFLTNLYPSDTMCKYYLRGSAFKGFGMRLEFTSFDLEQSVSCEKDNFTIYDLTLSSKMVGIKCGKGSQDFFINSYYILVVLKSDSQINHRGFHVKVQPCSQIYTSDNGTLTSPMFPSHYSVNFLCTYAIRLREGAKVQLVFKNMSLLYNDYLKIYDGRNSSARLITTLQRTNFKNILSSGNELFIEFKSYNYVNEHTVWIQCGFKLEYWNNQDLCSKLKPCQNNATCTDIPTAYECSCTTNYTGKNCSERISPCKSNPCLNNGTCTTILGDGAPTFRCDCLDEYVGTTCELHIDPCQNYTSENKWQRSTKSSFIEASMKPLCDSQLEVKWYRFTSKAGTLIPSYCPSPNSCGTSNAIWANGSLPSVAGNYSTLRACVRSSKSCCDISWPIRVRKCEKNTKGYFVYKLQPPSKCPMSYCAGSEVPCPVGSASLNGFTPCGNKVPVFNAVPKVSVSYENDRIFFQCDFQVANGDNSMTTEVIWFQGNPAVEVFREELQWWQRESRLKNKNKAKPLFKLGNTIYCKVRGWYGKFNGLASRYRESNHFYAGILVTPNTTYHRITEGGKPLKIELNSTVPVVCFGNAECQVHVQIIHETSEVLLNTCSVVFKRGVSSHTIEVHGKRDFINDGDKTVKLQIAVVDGSNAPDWQNHEKIKEMQVDVIDIGTARCSSNGDPRILTFDKMLFGHFQPGDHVLVKSISRMFEVHVRTWQCGSVTCNCGVSIKEGDDVILLDMCWDGIPRIRFLNKKTPAKGTVVKRDPTGKSVLMKFPSGAYVRVDNFIWSANIIVQVPSDDYQSTRGLCGTFDNHFHNDMLSKKGTYHDKYHVYGSTAPLKFTESWKLPVGKSLFYHRGKGADCKKEKKTYCDCKGDPKIKDGVKCKVHNSLALQPEFASAQDNWKEIVYRGSGNCKRRKRRSLDNVIILPDDDDAIDYVYDPKPLPPVNITWPTKAGKTQEQVTKYCNETVVNSAPGKVCKKIADFNFTSFMLQCIDDIQISDSYNFSSAAVRAMQDSCEEVFLKNTSYWEKDPANNGSFVPPTEMADTLCPGLCSGHGRCVKGKCICDANYTSADCSIDKTKGPSVSSIPGKGLCDVRNRTDCHLTRITGNDFIDSDDLSCRAIRVSIGGKQNIEEKLNRAYLLSFREVVCDIQKHPVITNSDPLKKKSSPFAIYHLQISNDKKVFSQKKVPYVIFDSKCMEYNSATLTCTKKSDTCIINGHCYAKGEKYKKDPCFVCKPSASTAEFSAGCARKAEQKKSNMVVIISVSVGSVLLVALIIIFATCMKRRATYNVRPPKKQAAAVAATFDNEAYTLEKL